MKQQLLKLLSNSTWQQLTVSHLKKNLNCTGEFVSRIVKELEQDGKVQRFRQGKDVVIQLI